MKCLDCMHEESLHNRYTGCTAQIPNQFGNMISCDCRDPMRGL